MSNDFVPLTSFTIIDYSTSKNGGRKEERAT
jgi:hypothetical protein